MRPPLLSASDAQMLHEILLSLVGYTGDLIVDKRELQARLGLHSSKEPPPRGEYPFMLAPDISFPQSEKDSIEKIVALGFYYRELNAFTTKSRDFSWISPDNHSSSPSGVSPDVRTKHGLSVYRRALANGFIEVLSLYKATVLHVEQKLLSDPVPILAVVTQALNKFFIIFPPLYEIILEIERDDIYGGKLLSFLYKRHHCGVPDLQLCIQRLLWHGHQVFYNQLAAWLVYGILHDPYGEFFIRRKENDGADEDSNNANMFEHFTRLSTDNSSLYDWHSGFYIVLEMLPEYIHVRVADSILFSGKAAMVLRSQNSIFNFQHETWDNKTTKVRQNKEFWEENKYSINDELFPQSDADKIESMIGDLKESSEFHKRSFECVVDSVRSIAANHLWQLVVISADLNGHLKALKDYFLLAKGDFFQCFLEESRIVMRSPPHPSNAEADLVAPYQQAAMKTIGDEDKYFYRVSLRIPSQISTSVYPGENLDPLSASSPEKDGWNRISLAYSVDWPLHLFFTQEVLDRYCRVFQHLIRLKRTQMELEKAWAFGMQQDHIDFTKHRKERGKYLLIQQGWQHSRPLRRIREHMAFFIRNLQFYIQVDVIESQWNILQNRIPASRDFTQLVDFHQEYLSALISQSFLDIGSVSRILDGLMTLCLEFCRSIDGGENRGSNSSTLEHISEEFGKKSNSLYTILRSSRLAGSQRAPFLRRFLLRLNFNSFFETTAKDVLSVVRPPSVRNKHM